MGEAGAGFHRPPGRLSSGDPISWAHSHLPRRTPPEPRAEAGEHPRKGPAPRAVGEGVSTPAGEGKEEPGSPAPERRERASREFRGGGEKPVWEAWSERGSAKWRGLVGERWARTRRASTCGAFGGCSDPSGTDPRVRSSGTVASPWGVPRGYGGRGSPRRSSPS